jgi:diphthamide synthase (EF-2-diphthine--ammonia ligase)
MAFGDLFLEDIRSYRESLLDGTGLTPVFPVWGNVTEDLATEMIDGGLRAVVTCIDPDRLSADFAGREYDAEFLADLPADVDPCGEYGEFHTCVCDGPFFTNRIDLDAGEIVERDGFIFADFRLRECS